MRPGGKHAPRPAGRAESALVLLAATVVAGATLAVVSRERLALRLVVGDLAGVLLAALVGSALLCSLSLLLLVSRGGTSGGAWRPAVGLRAAFVVLVSAASLHLVALQPYRSVLAHATLGLAAGVLGLLALGAPLLGRVLPGKALRRLDLLLFAACLAPVTAEVGLRALASVSDSPLLVAPHASLADFIERFRLRPEQAGPGFPVNSQGHFDEEFDLLDRAQPLAVTIGDSFSTSVVPHHHHFTTVAERALGRGAIANLGIAGAGLAEYEHLLRTEALPLQPDVVVVNLFVGNDLDDGLSDTRAGGRLERWLSAERLLLPAVLRRLWTLAGEHGDGGAGPLAARPVGTGSGGAGPGDVLDEEALLRLQPWLADPALEPPSFSEERFAWIERRRAAVMTRPDAPPDWGRVQHWLLRMRATCGNVPLAVMLIPDELQVEDDVWELAQPAEGGQGLVRDLPQRTLVPWLAEQGIPCLDLLPILTDVPPLADGRRHLYHLRDTHFNARGNAVSGEALAAFLRPWWDGHAGASRGGRR